MFSDAYIAQMTLYELGILEKDLPDGYKEEIYHPERDGFMEAAEV